MKLLQSLVTDDHIREIEFIKKFIVRSDKPRLIFLYGRYTGGELSHHLGGYDFLVVKDKVPFHYSSSIICKLGNQLPEHLRVEKRAGIYFRPSEDVRLNTYSDFYLNRVRNEGMILFDDGQVEVPERGRLQYGPGIKKAVEHCETNLETAQDILSDALHYLVKGHPRLCALNIGQSLIRFLRALEYSYFCHSPVYALITEHFRQIGPASAELYEYAKDNRMVKSLLYNMDSYRHDSGFATKISKPNHYLSACIGEVRNMGEIIIRECSGRMAYYKARL